VTYRGKKLSQADIESCCQNILSQESGLIFLTYILHEYCHIWDEINPGNMDLVSRHNFGMWLLKRFGILREDSLIDLTRRLLGQEEAAQLPEGEGK